MSDDAGVQQTELTTYGEWRVCGTAAARGSWDGPWKRTRPSRGDCEDLFKRNDKVWIERRTVTESVAIVEEILK